MKYNAEYVRERVGGSYELAVKVYELVSKTYTKPTLAPAVKWETAIRFVLKII